MDLKVWILSFMNINCSKGLISAVLVFLLNGPIQASSFKEKFFDDFHKTILFYKINQPHFQRIADDTGLKPSFIFSIVAPEITQFNMLVNTIQVSTLKVLYVEKGADYSNFSIGLFQMKPSFVEALEDEVKNFPTLKEKFANVPISSNDFRNNRVERIKRMTSMEWQFKYLQLFCEIMKIRYVGKAYRTVNEQLRFVSTAYNTGFQKPENEIVRMQKVKCFPLMSTTKYNYSEVALAFFMETRFEKH